MKVDPRNLRVAEAVRLLNSTPLGEVVQPHVVYRHLNRAAYKIGDGRKIDLVRYAAWLFHARRETFEPGWTEGNYEAHKDAVNARSRLASESSRDIAAEGWVHAPPHSERVSNIGRAVSGALTLLTGFQHAYFQVFER